MNSSDEKQRRPTRTEEKEESDRKKIIQFLKGRIPNADGVGCFLCRLITEDFEKNGRLTEWPLDFNDKGTFPRTGKILHIRAEVERARFP